MYGGLLEHFCVLVCMCASVHGWCTYAHVRVCTYECLRSYFIYSYIVACVCKFWIFEFTMNSFICVCVCAFIMVHLCTRSGSYMAVRRTHGISAWSQPIFVQSEICHCCTAVTNLVCIIVFTRIHAVDIPIKLHCWWIFIDKDVLFSCSSFIHS